jgi:hypothetical protein
VSASSTSDLSGVLCREHVADRAALSRPAPNVTAPRPSAATSVPALLHSLQSEWDSLMLESLALKQQYQSTRQELAHALYREDASLRVVARLVKERDQARECVPFPLAHALDARLTLTRLTLPPPAGHSHRFSRRWVSRRLRRAPRRQRATSRWRPLLRRPRATCRVPSRRRSRRPTRRAFLVSHVLPKDSL